MYSSRSFLLTRHRTHKHAILAFYSIRALEMTGEIWHEIQCASLTGGECSCRPKDVHVECRAQAAAHAREVLTLQSRLLAMQEALRTIRTLMVKNWSDNPNWRVGNEHTWCGQIDIAAERA